MSDLPDRLRGTAQAVRGRTRNLTSAPYETPDLMCEAADFIEAVEASERERLEREAVSPEINLGPDPATFSAGDEDGAGWTHDADSDDFVMVGGIEVPLFPMPCQYATYEAYTKAVVEWGRRVHEIETNQPEGTNG